MAVRSGSGTITDNEGPKPSSSCQLCSYDGMKIASFIKSLRQQSSRAKIIVLFCGQEGRLRQAVMAVMVYPRW